MTENEKEIEKLIEIGDKLIAAAENLLKVRAEALAYTKKYTAKEFNNLKMSSPRILEQTNILTELGNKLEE